VIRASIQGGAGYVGGELLRLLHDHPDVEVAQVTSGSHTNRFAHTVHPFLRGRSDLRFCAPEALESCDVLFLAGGHDDAADEIRAFVELARRVIDLSARFRLRSATDWTEWYGTEHAAPEYLERFVYGLPELHRDELSGARFASGVGCNATATNLALLPLARAGLIERAIVDLKVGSSEGGARASAGGQHPARSRSIRTYAATGHRHQAEIRQELGDFELSFTATAVDIVRGVACTGHVFPTEPITEKELWGLYREHYRSEPFVRIVKERHGLYRYPEPKLLAGTNYCDVGFEVDQRTGRIVVMSAIDNLMKGAAGSAVQSMNLMCGFEEASGLGFAGLHPV